ncbi:MAG: hypothetical protein WC634_03820 [archaeon]
MKWESIAVLCIIAYLAIALPLYILNQQAVKQCQLACEEEGFDLVVSAASWGEKTECRCFDSIARQEKFVTIS